MLAQCVNTPELQEIYDNIFGYEGSEIYFPNINDPEYKDLLSKHIGKTIKELNYLCDNIIVIGFYHYDPRYKRSRKKILLNFSQRSLAKLIEKYPKNHFSKNY